jgi:predicted ribosome quality control (RQC) complex YloA/Tae2 family protein
MHLIKGVITMNNNELYHHGVKGMKWGVRKARRKERAALNSAAKAATDERKNEALTRAEKYRKQADYITKTHYEAKAQKKTMRLNKDGSITEISKSEQVAKGKRIAKNILTGVGAAATVAAVAPAAAIGWNLVRMTYMD